MKTLRNTEAELSKSVAYAKKCVADDLRQLPERQKQIARHEIESAISNIKAIYLLAMIKACSTIILFFTHLNNPTMVYHHHLSSHQQIHLL